MEEAESSGEKVEEVIASVWELLMHFRDHREALVLALDQKKISMGCTPEQMVGSLTETPLGAIIFLMMISHWKGETTTGHCLSKLK